MLDHRREPARNHVSSFPAVNKSQASAGDPEFDFWAARETRCYGSSIRDSNGGDTGFQVHTHGGEGFGSYSPSLWKTSKSRNTMQESSPLLPSNHQYSNLSTSMRMKAIEEGRKELMEMIHNMPESTYELSLKDIVDEEHIAEEIEDELILEDRNSLSETEVQISKQKKNKKKSIKSGKISRSSSMDNEAFLLKIFFPSTRGSKRQVHTRKCSKISPKPSGVGSENRIYKGWSIKRILVTREGKNSEENSSSGSSSSSQSSTDIVRHGDGDSLTGCLPFFFSKIGKNKNQRAHLLNEDAI